MPHLLMRENFKQLVTRYTVDDAHAGILIQKGLRQWEDGEKPIKGKLVSTIANISPNDLYLLAFNRWLKTTYSEEDDATFAHVSAKIAGRLYTGLSEGSTLETGVTTHHSYGMPVLSGSSIKGAVRSYTEQLFAQRDENGNIKYSGKANNRKIVIQEDKQKILNILFGKDSDDEDNQADAGYIIWHDAWWIPAITKKGELARNANNKPFAEEVVTVHQQKYYQGELNQALDMESPVPNQQLAVQGGFYFVLEGDAKWVQFAKMLLEKTLQEHGMGAKGSSGYGYFILDEDLDENIRHRGSLITDVTDPDDKYGALKKEIRGMNSDALVQSLSRNKAAFFRKYGLSHTDENDCATVVNIIMAEERCCKFVNEWGQSNAHNAKRAYTFIQKYYEASQ